MQSASTLLFGGRWEGKDGGDVVRGDRRLQTDSAVPAVSPLNLNLPAPHGMSQPSMGLRFASEAQDVGVPSEGSFIETKFRRVTHMVHRDARAASSSCVLFARLSCRLGLSRKCVGILSFLTAEE